MKTKTRFRPDLDSLEGRTLLAVAAAGSLRKRKDNGTQDGNRSRRRRCLVEALESRTLLSTFLVTNTDDNGGVNPAPGAGTGTLRQAIIDANSDLTSPVHTIDFNIPGSGVHTIQPLSQLPDLQHSVIIDGYSQPGSRPNDLPASDDAVIAIDLNGHTAPGAYGLGLLANNCTIEGLAVHGFTSYGVYLIGQNEVIEGNFIGTNVSGTQADGNSEGISVFDGRGSRIGTNADGQSDIPEGTSDAAERNLISGNRGDGLAIGGGVVVAGNFVGTDVAGTSPLGNQLHGISIGGSAPATRIGTDGTKGPFNAEERNTISGNGGAGIQILGGAGHHTIAGNFIGTDVTGTQPLGNSGAGVVITSSNANLIGTNGDGVGDSSEANVISDNGAYGLDIIGNNNVVAGNLIGTDVTGTKPLGNRFAGINMSYASSWNRIGTDGVSADNLGERNIISGSQDGIDLGSGAPGQGNLIAGNWIGLGSDGSPIGNGHVGISIDGDSSDQIGGSPLLANTIAYNSWRGVVVTGSAVGVSVRANSIFENQGFGIGFDLGNDGVTQNNSHSGQSGPNNWQNFPVLSNVNGGSSTRVTGTLNSTPNTAGFILDFYANDNNTGSPSAYGQGQHYLGSYTTTAPTDANGNISFDVYGLGATTPGEWISATATDPGGNTSEFSLDIKAPPVVTVSSATPINEGSTFVDGGSFNDLDAYSPWTATVDYGDGSGVQPLTLNADKTFALSHTYADNGSYPVTVTVKDSGSAAAAGSATVTETVLNVPPTVGPITAPVSPTLVNTSITTSATFTDPGVLDTHTAVWNWGDGSTSAATVSETNGSGSVGGLHTYTTDGVYTVTLSVTDKDGGLGQSSFQYVVIYNPNAGFVTGGGTITSPSGAYAANPSLTGLANFGFVSKYQKGATVPTGNTQFQFQLANLRFQSTNYQWLVISGPQAQFKGSGTINGAGDDGFLLTAVDGELPGGGGSDKFRIKIWDNATGTVIYDNQTSASDTATPTTVIDTGDIVIHASSNTLQVAGQPGTAGAATPLTSQVLAPLVDAAIASWKAAGVSRGRLAALRQVKVQVDDLPGRDLAAAEQGLIVLDSNAAGFGWYTGLQPQTRKAKGGGASQAPKGVDLLTVLEHEFGHLLGFQHTAGQSVMADKLAVGVRRVPTPGLVHSLSVRLRRPLLLSHDLTGRRHPTQINVR